MSQVLITIIYGSIGVALATIITLTTRHFIIKSKKKKGEIIKMEKRVPWQFYTNWKRVEWNI